MYKIITGGALNLPIMCKLIFFVLLSKFDQFGPVTFGKFKIASWLFLIIPYSCVWEAKRLTSKRSLVHMIYEPKNAEADEMSWSLGDFFYGWKKEG